jgi:ribonuclease HI
MSISKRLVVAIHSESSYSTAEVLKRYSAGPVTGVFTDGSAVPNPGPGGWGYVYVVEGEIQSQSHGHHPQTTNNRMELTALIEAYKSLPQNASIMVYSDSNLCVQTVNQWAASWEKKGWRRKTGPISNLELVQELYALQKQRPGVRLEWIKAHNGWLWNEYADALSTAWMRQVV